MRRWSIQPVWTHVCYPKVLYEFRFNLWPDPKDIFHNFKYFPLILIIYPAFCMEFYIQIFNILKQTVLHKFWPSLIWRLFTRKKIQENTIYESCDKSCNQVPAVELNCYLTCTRSYVHSPDNLKSREHLTSIVLELVERKCSFILMRVLTFWPEINSWPFL